jgi:hypothetical protein
MKSKLIKIKDIFFKNYPRTFFTIYFLFGLFGGFFTIYFLFGLFGGRTIIVVTFLTKVTC